ncbi:hypothetical protein NO2_0265 [Candidatus Termititenax persephonae]|uniref:Uncharacterized protein n=1 Tax=Candidatus Termititenax persephonae TaxID=2218525 RepID=A0A388TFS4_9BACT|nr:hypothetical protein NO2_0265 [Candidatus Termititenax persephonae]
MRHGFAYVQLQVYFTLLVLILGGSMLALGNILRRDLAWQQRLQETVLVQNVLDKMVEDIKYADTVAVYADRVLLTRDGADYVYLLNNQRLARRKDAYLYLTPAGLALQSLSADYQNGLLEIVLHGGKGQAWTRLARR